MDPTPLLTALIRAAKRGPAATLDVASAALRDLGFAQRRTAQAPTAALFTRGEPRLLLSGHVDVVPQGEGWRRDPFGGEVADGRVWGRGASDMLGSVACYVAAAARAPRASCGILLTTDEETGMTSAARAVDEGWLAPFAGVVVGEPTGLSVGVAEKGVLWLRIETFGKNAHGSMPHLGDNAAERLVRVVARLHGMRPKGEHALLGQATMSVNRIGGGDAVNQVPALAFAEVDIRYLPGMGDTEVLGMVERAVKGEDARAKLSVLSSHAPFESRSDSELVAGAVEAARAAGRKGAIVGLPYGTEASKFAPAGVPPVILGPGEPDLAHTSRESISLEDLEAGVVCYQHLVERSG